MSGGETDATCMHEGCDCPVQDEADYCSETCNKESKSESAGELAEHGCHCGHNSCEPE